jgi:hypothetical protein
MNRGVRFKIPNQYGKFVVDVLEPVDCNKYTWYIDRNEIIVSTSDGCKELFKDQVVKGTDFSNLINNNIYYMIFAVLKAFPDSVSITQIATYEDFINSKCEIIMLVADCTFTDVYCKDISLIEKLYDNAAAKRYTEIEYIDENDSRTGMYV